MSTGAPTPIGDGDATPLGNAATRTIGERPIDAVNMRSTETTVPRSAIGHIGAPEEEVPFIPPMSANRRQRDDDEHRVPTYLQPASPSELFGTTENAVRPVIGE